MNKVLWHAISTGALVRSKPTLGAPIVRSISKGTWLGVIKELGEWIYVIGKESTGWVMKGELVALQSKTLHVHQSGESMLGVEYSI